MPKWNDLLLVTLEAYRDGQPCNNRAVGVSVADSLGLSSEQRSETYERSGYNRIENRVAWAVSALKTAGLLESRARGENSITEVGKDLLRERSGANFDEHYLIDHYPAYKENLNRNRENLHDGGSRPRREPSDGESALDDATPEELIDNAFGRLDALLQDQLLDQLRGMDPYKFEQVVADLLAAMGYGQTTVTKKSGDGGVDAIVDEDSLGLSRIYAQAKRYAETNVVHQQEMTNFLGAMARDNIAKGIFVTTSSFARDVKDMVAGRSIVLIDGRRLSQLLIRHNIGVAVSKTYLVKRIDTDYFDDSLT